ncbi:MAG: InlB B-repeat-containing protein [Bacilli bacterium]|nr:InlB B-repeat-containing protein [Bacilli bacterium]
MRKLKNKLFLLVFIITLALLLPLNFLDNKEKKFEVDNKVLTADSYRLRIVYSSAPGVSGRSFAVTVPGTFTAIYLGDSYVNQDKTINLHNGDDVSTAYVYKKAATYNYITKYTEDENGDYVVTSTVDGQPVTKKYRTETRYLAPGTTYSLDVSHIDPQTIANNNNTIDDNTPIIVTTSVSTMDLVYDADLPKPTRSGYKFLGWYASDGERFNNLIVGSEERYIPNDLYARWAKIDEDMICKRGKTLHSETCDRSAGGCYDVGYSLDGSKETTKIMYGALGNSGVLNTGDAFTCDVNGDGVFDENNERFYYVSDYFNTENNSFENDKAVLIYYKNTKVPYHAAAGTYNNDTHYTIDLDPSNGGEIYYPINGIEYYKVEGLYNYTRIANVYANKGLYLALSDAPITWNTYLINEERSILRADGYSVNRKTYMENSRFLTLQELNRGCNLSIGLNGGDSSSGALDNCEFLLEKTAYASTSERNTYWLETYNNAKSAVYQVNGADRSSVAVNGKTGVGAMRPAIEMYKSNMEINFEKNAHTVTYEGGSSENVAYGAEYTLPELLPKADEAVTVTLVNADGSSTENTAYTKQYILNGYTILSDSYDKVHFEPGTKITVTEDMKIFPEYVEVIQNGSFVFPELPEITSKTAHNVTFNYQDGVTANKIEDVEIDTTPYGWVHNSKVFDAGTSYEDNKSITVKASYRTQGGAFEAPERENYTFLGWFDSAEGGNQVIKAGVSDNTVLYAHWELENSNIKCKRAIIPHVIQDTSNIIIYGNYGFSGEVNIGDAFVCDVNGDGIYDDKEERFYYVSDYFNTETQEFESDTAVLIYNGFTDHDKIIRGFNSASSELTKYSSSKNIYYPELASQMLPDSSFWSNVSLKNTQRKILTSMGKTKIPQQIMGYWSSDYAPSWVQYNFDLKNNAALFDYTNHTSRLLTYQELSKACNITSDVTESNMSVDISNCLFMVEGNENTCAHYNCYGHNHSGYWLESISYSQTGITFGDSSYGSGSLSTQYGTLTTSNRVKPVIEVPINQLESNLNDYEHTVTVEGKETISVAHGTNYILPENDILVPTDGSATVTFNYQDGRDDTTSVYLEQHTPEGWLIDGKLYAATHYHSQPVQTDNNYVHVTKDIVATPYYDHDHDDVEFPNPYRNGYRFDGWYTEPDGGEKVTSYAQNDDITLYAHWVKQYDFYDYDYSWQQVDVGTEITLDEDDGGYNDFEDYLDFTFDYNYDDAPAAEYMTLVSEGEFDHWEINGITYPAGYTYVINDDTELRAIYRSVTDPETLPEEPIREGYKFIGWYTKAEGGRLIDIETIDSETYWNMNNHILYAHWVEFDPETQVMVNWDGNYKAYDKGAVVDLDIDENKYYDEHIADVTFNMQKVAYTSPTLEIKEKYTRDHYLINGEEHISTGTYTFNEDTTLKSVYTSEVIYPEVPTYDYEGFEGFYTDSDYRYGDEVTSLEGIHEDTEYYAHWYTEYVNVYVNGDLYNEYQEKGLDSLPYTYKDDGSYYFNFDYDVEGNDDFATKTLAHMYYYYNLQYYMIDDVRYETYEEYDYQDDTYLEGVYTQNGYFGSPYYNFYGDNFDIGRQREASEAGHYYYLEGWYTGKNGTGDKIDLSNIDHSLITSDATDSSVGQTLYANWILDPEVNVTIDDNEPYEYEAGPNLLIPEEKEVSTEKADDTFDVTFDYNDGTDRTMTEEVGRSYTFSYYTVDGKGNYQRNDIYNFYKDTTIESVYNISYDYPEVPTLDVPKFKGFYTKPSGGYKVESFYDINVTGPITLYAQYYTGMVHVNFDGEEYDVEAGTAITLEAKDPFNKTITLNFDYNNGYHPKKQAHIITTYNTDSYQVETDNNSYWHSPNDVYICGEDSKITTNYSTESSNDFEGYSDNEWDMGLQYTNNSDITFRLDHWESNVNPNGGDCGRECGGEIGHSPGPNADQEYGSGSKNNPRPGEDDDEQMYYVDFWSIMDNPEPYEGATLYASWDTAWVNIEYYDTIDDYTWSSNSYQSGNYIDWIPDYQKDGYFFDGWYSDRTNWTGKLTENTKAIKDITYYGRWIEDTRDDPDNQCMVVNQDGTTQIVAKGDTYPLGTNNIAREDEEIAEVMFEYEDEETPADIDYVTKTFTPNGWLVNDEHFDDDEEITCDSDVCFVSPDYTEEIISPEFPEPERDDYTLKGWYNFPEGGTKYTEYTGTHDMTFYAQWELAKPTDFALDSDDLMLMAGDTHQIAVTFTPEGTTDNLVYSEYDDEVISVTSEGLITAIAEGETTITVALESDNTVTKTINVTVLTDEITSSVLTVATKELARIIIGEEPKTTIEDFLSKIDNPLEYIQIYDQEDTLIDDYDTMLTTGMKVKLVVNDHEYDEAIAIIRGDIDEDGQVQPADNLLLKDHLLKKAYITGYRLYAADVDEEEGVLIENAITPSDNNKLMNYLLKKSSTLND